jgi:hypothetical protein
MNTAAECLEILEAQSRCRDLARHDELVQDFLALVPYAVFDEAQFKIFSRLNSLEMFARAAKSRWVN